MKKFIALAIISASLASCVTVEEQNYRDDVVCSRTYDYDYCRVQIQTQRERDAAVAGAIVVGAIAGAIIEDRADRRAERRYNDYRNHNVRRWDRPQYVYPNTEYRAPRGFYTDRH